VDAAATPAARVNTNLRKSRRENNRFISGTLAMVGMQCALLH
jgi:hypothetical protein